MITAFLLARQGALEGPGIFPSYSDWFKVVYQFIVMFGLGLLTGGSSYFFSAMINSHSDVLLFVLFSRIFNHLQFVVVIHYGPESSIVGTACLR